MYPRWTTANQPALPAPEAQAVVDQREQDQGEDVDQREAGQLRAQVLPAGPDRKHGVERHAGRDDDESAPYQVVRQSHEDFSLDGRTGSGDWDPKCRKTGSWRHPKRPLKIE